MMAKHVFPEGVHDEKKKKKGKTRLMEQKQGEELIFTVSPSSAVH